jgi:hypothetical protein
VDWVVTDGHAPVAVWAREWRWAGRAALTTARSFSRWRCLTSGRGVQGGLELWVAGRMVVAGGLGGLDRRCVAQGSLSQSSARPVSEEHLAYVQLARDRDLLVEKLVEAARIHKATSAVRAVTRDAGRAKHPLHMSLQQRQRGVPGGAALAQADTATMWPQLHATLPRWGYGVHGQGYAPVARGTARSAVRTA